jgi:hypothetical protein
MFALVSELMVIPYSVAATTTPSIGMVVLDLHISQITAMQSQSRKKVIPVCFAVAPGSSTPGTCGPPPATGSFRPTASATTAFVLPEVRQQASRQTASRVGLRDETQQAGPANNAFSGFDVTIKA